MEFYIKFTLFMFNIVCGLCSKEGNNFVDDDITKLEDFVFWPNAIVPFYIRKEHYDPEQLLAIATTINQFTYKTCIKFNPLSEEPSSSDHVLVFENPFGIRKCVFDKNGHSRGGLHVITLGYNCLTSPEIDMHIMRALGFPFEHNRASRDVYINVLLENVDPGMIEFFTKDFKLPPELRALSYDIDSVMHFDFHRFSKNGHRTILPNGISPNHQQKRVGLTATDINKMDIVYGPECLKRDRQEKIDRCQKFPGVVRRKREVEDPDAVGKPEDLDVNSLAMRSSRSFDVTGFIRVKRDAYNDTEIEIHPDEKIPEPDGIKKELETIADDRKRSLRVNPDITPPPEVEGVPDSISDSITELGIANEVQEIVEQVHKIAALALRNARQKYCNETVTSHRANVLIEKNNTTDILGIIGSVADYAKEMVDRALANITAFCETSKSIDGYERVGCQLFDSTRCKKTYFKSTKSGRVKYKTQHRPVIRQSTKHESKKKFQYVNFRASNSSGDVTITEARVKRDSEIKLNNMIEVKDIVKLEPVIINATQNDTVQDDSAKALRMRTTVSYPKRYADDERGNRHKDERYMDIGSRRFGFLPKKITTKKATDEAPEDNVKMRSNVKSHAMTHSENNENIESHNYKDKGQYVDEFLKKTQHEKPVRGRVESYKNEAPNDDVLTPNRYKKSDHEIQAKDAYQYRKEDEEIAKAIKYSKIQERKKQLALIKIKKARINQHIRGTEEKESSENVRFIDSSEDELKDLIKPKDESDDKDDEKEAKIKGVRTKKREEPEIAAERIVEHQNEKGDAESSSRKPKGARNRQFVPQIVNLSQKNKEFYEDRSWPDGVVYYLIHEDPNFDMNDMRRRLAEVDEILEEKTCVRLKEIREEDTDQYEDYLVLDSSPDYVTGRVGGRQNFGVVELFRGGQHRQHAAMMAMAMLGFYFEVSRHDRDQYIRVHMRHVRPDKLHHFEKIRSDATLDLPYDYNSATHPAWQFWRQIGRTGISTVATYKEQDPDGSIMKSLGQREELLSDLDLVKINSVYGTKCFRGDVRRMSRKHKNEHLTAY